MGNKVHFQNCKLKGAVESWILVFLNYAVFFSLIKDNKVDPLVPLNLKGHLRENRTWLRTMTSLQTAGRASRRIKPWCFSESRKKSMDSKGKQWLWKYCCYFCPQTKITTFLLILVRCHLNIMPRNGLLCIRCPLAHVLKPTTWFLCPSSLLWSFKWQVCSKILNKESLVIWVTECLYVYMYVYHIYIYMIYVHMFSTISIEIQ